MSHTSDVNRVPGSRKAHTLATPWPGSGLDAALLLRSDSLGLECVEPAREPGLRALAQRPLVTLERRQAS